MCGNGKLRQMTEVKEHYIRECVQRNLVQIKWICSKEQISDIMTKPLSYELHNRLAGEIMNK